jgi:hypothetical protein
MKALWKVLGVILACLVLLLVVARIAGFEPNGRRPGLWLKGDLVTTPVTGRSPTRFKTSNFKPTPGISFHIPLLSIVSPIRGNSTWIPFMPRGSPTLTAAVGTRT